MLLLRPQHDVGGCNHRPQLSPLQVVHAARRWLLLLLLLLLPLLPMLLQSSLKSFSICLCLCGRLWLLGPRRLLRLIQQIHLCLLRRMLRRMLLLRRLLDIRLWRSHLLCRDHIEVAV